MIKYIFGGILLIAITFFACNKTTKQVENPLFTKISSDHSGVKFVNTVSNTKDINILTYRNYYNGGGTAIGDINNDGLSDVFFTANMGENKLYLNKGNMQFEDISAKAGIQSADNWSTGVVMVDINNDKFLDIYVCNAGYKEGKLPYNQLFINNGDLTFTEKAAEYGLNDDGYTTHAAFFDYDGDNDLDCYILNNSFIPVNTLNNDNRRTLRAKDWPVAPFLQGGGDKLMRNDNGKFTDVSEKAGIYGSLIGFGLGVTVGDVDNDGWLDIYVSNDFYERDYLYINQKNGTYKEDLTNQMQHLSLASMGSDMADVNNDGNPDIFATEMLPYDEERLKATTEFENIDVHNIKVEKDFFHQYSQNTLQINQGDGTFKEAAHYAGVAASDWSWGALIFDADFDGNQDLFICNGIYHDVIDQDFIDFFANEVMQRMAMTGKKEEVENIIEQMPSVPIQNLMFRNTGNLKFEDVSNKWGFSDKTFSNGAAYGDLDNDGDLDLIINNENQEALLYQNNATKDATAKYIGFQLKGDAKNTFAVGAKVKVFAGENIYQKENIPSRGFQSSVDYKLMIGLPKDKNIDSIHVIWHDRTFTKVTDYQLNKLNTIDFLSSKKSKYNFKKNLVKPFMQEVANTLPVHTEDNTIDFYTEKTIHAMLSAEGPKVAVGDVNGDGEEDLYICSARNQPKRIYIAQNGTFKPTSTIDITRFIEFEDTAAEFFDADGDKDLDLIVGSGGNWIAKGERENQDRLYINDGKGNFSMPSALPLNGYNTSVILPFDYDSDGDMDIFVGSRSVPQLYGIAPKHFIYQNDGTGKFIDVQIQVAPILNKIGMITSAQYADLDGDGGKELVVVGEWMKPTILKYTAGKFDEKINDTFKDKSGFWYNVTVADLDADGDNDMILGNSSENCYLADRNEPPIKLWINDFDGNGFSEKVLSYSINEKDVPVIMKREMTKEMPPLKKKILKHHEYAKMDMTKLFDANKLKKAEVKEARYFKNIFAINDGKGNFILQEMPLSCQMSSICSVLVTDINNDEKPDIVLGGNHFTFQPQYGRLDASYGEVLINQGNMNFKPIQYQESGVKINGMIRDIKRLKIKGQDHILIAVNNEKVRLLKLNQQKLKS